MEIVFQVLTQLPSGWPRVAVLLGLVTLLFLPEIRQMLAGRLLSHGRLRLAKQLLELRQLQIAVEELKAQHPGSTNEAMDSRIRELLDESPWEDRMAEPIPWANRVVRSLTGSFALMLLGTIALWHTGKLVGQDTIRVIVIELGYTSICGILASALPARHTWECVLRGILVPALLGALMASLGKN